MNGENTSPGAWDDSLSPIDAPNLASLLDRVLSRSQTPRHIPLALGSTAAGATRALASIRRALASRGLFVAVPVGADPMAAALTAAARDLTRRTNGRPQLAALVDRLLETAGPFVVHEEWESLAPSLAPAALDTAETVPDVLMERFVPELGTVVPGVSRELFAALMTERAKAGDGSALAHAGAGLGAVEFFHELGTLASRLDVPLVVAFEPSDSIAVIAATAAVLAKHVGVGLVVGTITSVWEGQRALLHDEERELYEPLAATRRFTRAQLVEGDPELKRTGPEVREPPVVAGGVASPGAGVELAKATGLPESKSAATTATGPEPLTSKGGEDTKAPPAPVTAPLVEDTKAPPLTSKSVEDTKAPPARRPLIDPGERVLTLALGAVVLLGVVATIAVLLSGKRGSKPGAEVSPGPIAASPNAVSPSVPPPGRLTPTPVAPPPPKANPDPSDPYVGEIQAAKTPTEQLSILDRAVSKLEAKQALVVVDALLQKLGAHPIYSPTRVQVVKRLLLLDIPESVDRIMTLAEMRIAAQGERVEALKAIGERKKFLGPAVRERLGKIAALESANVVGRQAAAVLK